MLLPRRLRVALITVLTVALLASGCSVTTKDFDALFGGDLSVDALETAQSSQVFDRNGTLITTLRGPENRRDVSFHEIPEVLYNAVVAVEDERFWDHSGVDLKGILRAARSNVSAGGVSEGGSTITQQYVGNVFLDRTERTAGRKVEEIFMARTFEQRYTKEFILERYLNWVNFGNGAYGVEAAAREYFGAPDCAAQVALGQSDDVEFCLKISELTLVESATLAGLIRAPGAFDPYKNYEAALERRNLVLARMLANGYIAAEEYDLAVLEPITLVEHVSVLEEEYPAAHFVEDVKQWFFDNPEFGETRDDRIRLLFEGGLKIYTTIDLELQAEAEAGVERVLPQVAENGTLNPDAAAVIMGTTPEDDGHILAMVGGRDFFAGDDDAKFNLASGSGRQAGSAMKPIGLAAALNMGISISHYYDVENPVEITHPSCGRRWRVRGGGPSTLYEATVWSRNVVYAQLVVDTTPQRFVEMAELLGIPEGRIQPVCAAILGTENVNMVEMATVNATFARNGERVSPVMVTRIVNLDGTTLYESQAERAVVLSPGVGAQITDALRNVIARGTGRRAQLDGPWPVAGKTGTAQNNADAAFAGYTAQRSVAVWVGYPDSQEPMLNQFRGGRVQGGTFPALIFSELMTAAMQGLEPIPFPGADIPPTTTTLPVAPEFAVVPDLIGQKLGFDDEDQPVLDNAELNARVYNEAWILSVVVVPTLDHEPGTIFSQFLPAGLEVAGGSVITIEVAAAPVVDDVVGMTTADAIAAIEKAGLTAEVVSLENPDGGTAPGIVWSQDPVAGAENAVTVTISVQPPDEPETTTTTIPASTTTSASATTTARPTTTTTTTTTTTAAPASSTVPGEGN